MGLRDVIIKLAVNILFVVPQAAFVRSACMQAIPDVARPEGEEVDHPDASPHPREQRRLKDGQPAPGGRGHRQSSETYRGCPPLHNLIS